jgi:hypothetical protein
VEVQVLSRAPDEIIIKPLSERFLFMLELRCWAAYAKAMAELPIDYERMADSLERALYEVDNSAGIPASMRLMTTYCGFTAVAVAEYTRSLGYDAKAVVNEPAVSGYPNMMHAFTEVMVDDDPIIIDATYGQFMGYAGLGLLRMHRPYYPEHQIIEFRKSNFHYPVDVLTDEINNLREAISRGETTTVPFGGRFQRKTSEEIRTELAKIWNPVNRRLYIPSAEEMTVGRQLAARLKTDLL